jgi:hypothetical protein
LVQGKTPDLNLRKFLELLNILKLICRNPKVEKLPTLTLKSPNPDPESFNPDPESPNPDPESPNPDPEKPQTLPWKVPNLTLKSPKPCHSHLKQLTKDVWQLMASWVAETVCTRPTWKLGRRSENLWFSPFYELSCHNILQLWRDNCLTCSSFAELPGAAQTHQLLRQEFQTLLQQHAQSKKVWKVKSKNTFIFYISFNAGYFANLTFILNKK